MDKYVRILLFSFFTAVAVAAFTGGLSAQNKTNQRPVKAEPTPKPVVAAAADGTVYRYEFTRPDFLVPYVKIEHNSAGVGTIAFRKLNSDETITEPLTISAAALKRITDAFTALDFVNSTENYQFQNDYPHLGTKKIVVEQKGKRRETSFNFSEVPAAKVIADEYRRLSNQNVWIFDMDLARRMQPLDAPRQMDALAAFIRTSDISDLAQLEPFLKELSNDESIPLIARNHAARILKLSQQTNKK